MVLRRGEVAVGGRWEDGLDDHVTGGGGRLLRLVEVDRPGLLGQVHDLRRSREAGEEVSK